MVQWPLENRPFTFTEIPEPMEEDNSQQERFRPFLNMLRELMDIRDQRVLSPIPYLRSFIHECFQDNFRQYFEDIGECQNVFIGFGENDVLKAFFRFCRPLIRIERDISGCTLCNAPAVLGSARQEEECILQIDTFDPTQNQTLSDLIMNYFNDWTREQTNCNLCADGEKTITTRTLLLRQSELLVVCLGRERYDPVQGMIELNDPIQLGGNVTIRINDQDVTYRLISCVNHLYGSTNGHFIAFLRHNERFFVYNDANDIKLIDDSEIHRVQRSNLFLYIRI